MLYYVMERNKFEMLFCRGFSS